MMPAHSLPSRATTAAAIAVLAGVVAGCSQEEAGSPPTPSTEPVSVGSAIEIPDADGPFLDLGNEPLGALASRCVTSTPARSTVEARTPDGTEVAVTVFTRATPVVEVDIVTSTGSVLSNGDLGRRGGWRFDDTLLLGRGTLGGDPATGAVDIAFAVDFSAGLPECDDQDELGPGNVEPSGSETPDVIRT